jgi:hypothetical protein
MKGEVDEKDDEVLLVEMMKMLKIMLLTSRRRSSQ